MSQYTPIERFEIVELYIENKKSIILNQRAFRAKFPKFPRRQFDAEYVRIASLGRSSLEMKVSVTET